MGQTLSNAMLLILQLNFYAESYSTIHRNQLSFQRTGVAFKSNGIHEGST